MAPFSNTMEKSNLRLSLIAAVVPMLILGAVLIISVSNSPSRVFEKYQKAVRQKDWKAVLDLSDKTTHDFLTSLDQWIWTGGLNDLVQLDPRQQFLIYTARCRIISENRPRPDKAELLGIWMESLKANRIIPGSTLRNSYFSGDRNHSQLFHNQSNNSTGLKIIFVKDDGWKVEAIGLLYEAHKIAFHFADDEPLRFSNPDYFRKGFINEHTKPLSNYFASKDGQ